MYHSVTDSPMRASGDSSMIATASYIKREAQPKAYTYFVWDAILCRTGRCLTATDC